MSSIEAKHPDQATLDVERGVTAFANERKRAEHFKLECNRLYAEAKEGERLNDLLLREVETLKGVNATLQGRLEHYMRYAHEIAQSINIVVRVANDALVQSRQNAWRPDGPRPDPEKIGIDAVQEAMANERPSDAPPVFLSHSPVSASAQT